MLTNQELEAAARELCRMRGIDPDAVINYCPLARGGVICDNCLRIPAWEKAAEEIARHAQIAVAVAVAVRGYS